MKRILVVQDTEQIENSIHLLQFCEKMYGTNGYEVFLLAFEDSLVRVFGFFHCIYTVPTELVDLHDFRYLCDIVEDLHTWNCFDSILVPATRLGRMLAPRLAKRLHTGLVADVIDIKTDGEQLEMIRTAYSGSIHAGIVATGTTPVMMSVHPGTCTYRGRACLDTVVIPYTEAPKKSRNVMRCIDMVTRAQSYDIRTSDILVSGGGGVKKQQLPLLQRLAEALGGDVSASRKLVDQGLAPRNIQVGQSGKMVSARLYIALGIDGAIQHVEGLRNVETIIAVNTRIQAPVCSLSDIVVQGDAGEFIEKLLKKIEHEHIRDKGEQP